MKLNESSVKENFTKERAKNSKLGILGETAQPTKRAAIDVKGKSWNQLANDLIEEMNLN